MHHTSYFLSKSRRKIIKKIMFEHRYCSCPCENKVTHNIFQTSFIMKKIQMIIISARCIRLDVHKQMFDEGSLVKEFEWER